MQKRIHNSKVLREARKDLRNNLTHEEAILWNYLKQSKMGYKFRRQHSIGIFVADFYCPMKKLVIELDGMQHLNNREYDKERSDYFNSLGIMVMRFLNTEVHKNLLDVILTIKLQLGTR